MMRTAWHACWQAVLCLGLVLVCANASAQGDDDVVYIDGRAVHPSRVLVRTRGGLSSSDVVAESELVGTTVTRELELAGVTVLEIATPGSASITSTIEGLVATGLVEYAEPDFAITLEATPDDPQYGSLWGLHNTGQLGGTPDADIDAPEAWDVVTSSPGVVVVIDTGIDYTHPDLAANMWVNPGEIPGNDVDDDDNGYVDDVYGISALTNDGDPMDDHRHGTHVAGTIGASGDNAIGVVGVSWNTQLMACKFLNSGGSGFTSDAVQCLEYAALMKHTRGIDVRVTNNSWGGGGYSQAMYDAIQSHDDLGILFVAAAGNASNDNDLTPHYPSSYENANVLAVASTDRNDLLSGFSSYGATTVDLGAPGSAIVSTFPGNTYGTLSGTSMATPHVAGAALLTWGQHPAYSHLQVKQALMTGVDPLPALEGRTLSGGRLNLFRTALCVPGDWQLSTSLSTGFSVIAGRPVVVTAQLVSCTLAVGADVVASFSNGDPSLTLLDDGNAPDATADDGVYSGSWLPGAVGAVDLRVDAEFESAPYSLVVEGTVDEGEGLVGYYDMSGAGVSSQVPPILAAGLVPVYLEDLTPTDLAGLEVLFVQNGVNASYGAEYLARLGSIEQAVEDGLVLILHDRKVAGAETILPGGAGFEIVRNFDDDANVEILDDTTLVTDGPGGLLDDVSLDGGRSSSHGFAVAGSLPGDADLILSRTVPSETVTMCYEFGNGSVVYSTIPLDHFLSGSGFGAVQDNMTQIYAPNVVAYGADGACGGPCLPRPYELSGSLDEGFSAYEARERVITARLTACERAHGATVEVRFSDGDPTLPLLDDGVAPDVAAGDGIYSVPWVPVHTGPVIATLDAVFESEAFSLGISGTVHPLPEFSLGMVADDTTNSVLVFDAVDDVPLGSVAIEPGSAVGDCAITRDQAFGFVTDFLNQVWVIDLTTLELASGPNPIAISNHGEDISLSPDEKYLLACDGSAPQPVSVIDVASRAEVATFPMSRGCNSVEVCNDGSVLVTSYDDKNVRRLLLGDDGSLTDTGESLRIPTRANNVVCDPNGTSGVVVTRNGALRSFTIPGLTPGDSRSLTGDIGISGAINEAGDQLFARSNGGYVNVFDYEPGSAGIGPTPSRTLLVADTPTFFGMDQLALHPGTPKLYVSQPAEVDVYDATNGQLLTTMQHPSLAKPTGVCLARLPLPDEVCGEIDDEDFGEYEELACAPADEAGTVRVFDAAQLDAYHADFGFDGLTLKNLEVRFNPVGDVEIRSPCQVTVEGEEDGVDIVAGSVRVFGRAGVVVATDASVGDTEITSAGALTLVSTEGDARFVKEVELEARKICLQAEGTARVSKESRIEAEIVELVSTGDREDSNAVIDNETQVTADLLRIEASRRASLAKEVVVDVGELILRSTGDQPGSIAIIEKEATVTAGSLSIASGYEVAVRKETLIRVAGDFEVSALDATLCTIDGSAAVSYGSLAGNCAPHLPEPSEVRAQASVPSLSAGLRILTVLLMGVAGYRSARTKPS